MKNLSLPTLLGLLVVFSLVGALLYALAENSERQRLYAITTFEECAAAGNPIDEKNPRECRTSDGRVFVEEGSDPITFNGCAVAGCSGQLCISAEEAAAGGGVSTCEFRAEYACYREASCEPQADGKCGWTETDDLKRCLANPPALE